MAPETVEAKDRCGIWYRAKIVAVRGEGDGREVKAHFLGWAKRFDEWFAADSASLRPAGSGDIIQDERIGDYERWDGHVDEDTWEVSKVLKKRCRQNETEYLVMWAGWDASHNSWVPEDDISEELLENLDVSHFGDPYVLEAEHRSHIDPAVAADLVSEWLHEIGRKSAHMLKRSTTEEYASRRVVNFSPCPPWLFVAIHDAINGIASEIEGTPVRLPPLSHAHSPLTPPRAHAAGDATSKVTDIVGVKGTNGGKHVVDRFEILSTEVVEKLVGEFNTVGHGALAFRKMNTAVMLLPPLIVTFKTFRTNGLSARKFPTELSLTGHFSMLVDRKAMRKDPLFKFDEDRAVYSDELKLSYKIAFAAAMRALGPGVVPAHLLKFLELL